MESLHPIPFTRVNLRDSFWAPRLEVNRRATIPHVYDQCERTGRLAAWDLAWRPGDPNPPHVFWDSDVAKWLEAAACSLAAHPDPALDARLDALIAKMARAQRPDGYLNTHYIAVEPEARWTNLRDRHELYCAGHLIEAGVAHFQATGRRTLLDVVRRYADHVDGRFGREPGKARGYPGHEEIELALVKLYRATGEARYLRLAQYFVDERGRQPHYYDLEARARGEDPAAYYFKTYAYMQAHVPVREQAQAVGHAVRAMYLYSAVADLARETGDEGLLQVCERLWRGLVSRRLYVTGGIGSLASNEGFSEDYDLPDEAAYAETCAAIGLIFWGHRMLQLTGDAGYADVLERALYNGVLGGVSLDGRRFFYENPLASRGGHHRQEWYSCACCPPNIARLLAGAAGYFFSQDADGVWVHLYAAGEVRFEAEGREAALRVETDSPWDGRIALTVQLDTPAKFTLRLRAPGWCDRWTLEINGESPAEAARPVRSGYIHLAREWLPDDRVTLNLDMPVRYVFANPNVPQALGRAALQRGPLVYCLEGVDHEGAALGRISLPPGPAAWRAEHRPDLLGGVTVLRAAGRVARDDGWDDRLYRFQPPEQGPLPLTAVPYCVWDNRAAGEMRVWLMAAG